MADVKVVRGTIGGAVVETSEENAARLGSAFKPEKRSAERRKTDPAASLEADDTK